MLITMLRRPSAVVPVAMSAAALALVFAYLALHGTARQEDEGAAAHLWQLLMAGQLPIIGYFALRWLPIEPRPTLIVLSIQLAAGLASAFPIWWFGW